MDVFYALAEPRRRKIIELLASSGQLSAGDIYKRFDITAQAVSQHLGILLGAGLLRMRKQAQQHIYELNPESISELGDWVDMVEKQWDLRLDRLDKLLKRERKLYAKRGYNGR